jgi:lipid-binding SYLF domain-containing protein
MLAKEQQTNRIALAAVVQADRSGDHAMYGANVNRREILDGKVQIPASARPLLRNIAKYAREAKRQG